MLAAGLNDAAGRTAYLAAFHVAQAFIFERNGKAVKTHNGVQTEFLRLTRTNARLSQHLRTFLSVAYNLKSIADYETDPSLVLSTERATESLAMATQFVDAVSALVETSDLD